MIDLCEIPYTRPLVMQIRCAVCFAVLRSGNQTDYCSIHQPVKLPRGISEGKKIVRVVTEKPKAPAHRKAQFRPLGERTEYPGAKGIRAQRRTLGLCRHCWNPATRGWACDYHADMQNWYHGQARIAKQAMKQGKAV